MKKILKTLVLLLALTLAGTMLYKKAYMSETMEKKTVKFGTMGSFPFKNIAEIVKKNLEKENINVEITYFSDYTQPNVALAKGDIDTLFAEHVPYMNVFSKKLNGNFVAVTPVYNYMVAFYSKNHKSLNDLPKGALIVLPNDPVNLEWALEALNEKGLITLGDKKGAFYNLKDIKSTKNEYMIKTVKIPALSQMYHEADLVFNWPSHMIKMGLSPTKDGLLVIDDKKNNDIHGLVLATTKDKLDSDVIKAMKKAITSKEIKEFLEKEYKEEAYPLF